MIRALPIVIGLSAACATTIEQRARRAAEEGIDPAPLVTSLAAEFQAIEATKRIFDVTLIEGRRRFRGEGVVQYRALPRRLRADIFGPHSTPVLHLTLVDDHLTVVLPREGETLSGQLGDPRFDQLTGEVTLVSREMLGAILGAYDLEPLLDEARIVAAAQEDGRRTLYLVNGAAHAFTVEDRDGDPRLVEYRQGRDGRLVYRVRFEEYAPIDGRQSPRHIVARDYVKERTIVVDVTREHGDVPSDPTTGPAGR